MPDIRVLAQYCKGCGLCVPVCPKNTLNLSDTVDRHGIYIVCVNPEIECTGCGNCTQICPDAALEIIP